ncbi:hypothetical protein RHCH11_RHCH11_02014 [Beijerinckiaceae bacterium RH CH11]|nr:DUF4166 domain-containing protein [Beijerinckiaceae bacterium]VVB45984.1 hypothetical protein RHCH11_RHCH11_02014 [Beijerinckiaceae bacterium RH CH11]VVB46064.1 hypothetical protein RHAL8_02010 [Beijerinckiaceae bacterium RH AL8]
MAPEPQVDPRFRALLTAEDWARLPAPVQRRFSQRLEGGASHIYRGEIVETTMSRAGHWLSQIARLVGAPLPLWRDDGVAAVVTVTEDVAGNGQHWTRVYARRGGFPQIVRSSKRFAGPTGLEELVGYGLGMALVVEAQADALVFRSAAYFVDLGLVRLTVPGWLTPGALTNTHRERGRGRFLFELDLVHPRLGRLIRQVATFEETDREALRSSRDAGRPKRVGEGSFRLSH